jgi:hypothetical protein
MRRSHTLLAILVLSSAIAPVASAQTTGQIIVTTTPSGANVSVDGEPVGASPAIVRDLMPGAHLVSVAGADGAHLERIVEVAAGQSMQVPMELAPAPPAAVVAPPPPPPTVAEQLTPAASPSIPTLEPIEANFGLAREPEGGWNGNRGQDHGLLVAAVILLGLGAVGFGLFAVDPLLGALTGPVLALFGGIFLIIDLSAPSSPGPARESGAVYGAIEGSDQGGTIGIGWRGIL